MLLDLALTGGRPVWETGLGFFQGRFRTAVKRCVMFHQNSEFQLISFECLLHMEFIL